MNKKIIYSIFVLIFLCTKSYSEKQAFITHKVGNEIITNVDIENEANYLISLN